MSREVKTEVTSSWKGWWTERRKTNATFWALLFFWAPLGPTLLGHLLLPGLGPPSFPFAGSTLRGSFLLGTPSWPLCFGAEMMGPPSSSSPPSSPKMTLIFFSFFSLARAFFHTSALFFWGGRRRRRGSKGEPTWSGLAWGGHDLFRQIWPKAVLAADLRTVSGCVVQCQHLPSTPPSSTAWTCQQYTSYVTLHCMAQECVGALRLIRIVIHVVRLSVVCSLLIPQLVPFRVFLQSLQFLPKPWPVPLPPCGRHRGN